MNRHRYDHRVVRWEPGTHDRLREAALELFARKGFEETTTAEIAAAAGVTERTFFRNFADKRDVLFASQEDYVGRFLAGVAAAPTDAPPLRLVAAAIESGSTFFTDELRPHSRKRQTVIDANPALKERELLKGRRLAAALGAALAERGVPEPAATLAGETGASVFHVAFTQWIEPGETRSVAEIATALIAELGALHAG